MSLSERTKKLLLGGEGIEVEYKTKVHQDFNDILVAFANGNGGIILFGVEDDEDETGKHVGKVVGIAISDRTRGQIQSRADQTFDKIDISIESENDEEGKDIYVVTVKEGKNKPYCTGGGRYLVRRDGQNSPITPTMMEEFIALRIQKTPSAKKQLLLDEMRELKSILQEGLANARRNYPPYYTQYEFGMMRDGKIDASVGNLTVDDKHLIQACNDFVETSKIFAREWFSAAERAKKDAFGESSREEIVKKFLEADGEKYKSKLEELYKAITKRIYAILS